MLRVNTNVAVISTGIREISEELGGGIRPGSLVFIEGEAECGKSVLAQHLAYGALTASPGNAVAYYTTEYDAAGLVNQMHSLSLKVRDYFLAGSLRIYPMTVRNYFGRTQKYILHVLTNHLAGLPERFNLVIVDAVTLFLTHVDLLATVDFFQNCREFCRTGRSLVLVANTHAFKKETINRAFALSDDYIHLRTEDALAGSDQREERILRVLEVTKLKGAERPNHDSLRFEIKHHTGIQILPFVKVRI